MSGWTCTSCGVDGNDVFPSAARPSLDDRYAVGYCANCAPVPPTEDPSKAKRRSSPPRTVQLIRTSLWDADELARRRQRAADHKLVDRLMKGDIRLSEAERVRARELIAQWDAAAATRSQAPL